MRDITVHLKSYKVRDIEIKNGLVLAPMSGVTTRPFRRLIKELNHHNLGLVLTEFISVEGLTRKAEKSLAMMKYSEIERPLAIQIFGYDIARMTEAASMVQASGAEIVDINCGCPAPKVVRKGGGCNLMREPDHLQKIIRSVRKEVTIPLTIKIRSGWDENSKNALEIALMAEAEGVNAVAVHGRTRTQLYRGEADWDLVAKIASSLKIPVLGSGDVKDFSGAEERLGKGVVGLYIGRGAMENPFIFNDIVNKEKTVLRTDPLKAIGIILRYRDLLLEDFSPMGAVGKIKQLVSQMCRGLEWRKEICIAKSLEEIDGVLKSAQDKAKNLSSLELAA